MDESGSSLRDQGLAAFRAGRTEEAVRLLREAVAADPRDYRAYCVLGAAHVQRGEYDDAIAAFEHARGISPDAAHIHYNLGLACQRAGRLEQAIAAFQGAVEVDPSYEKARDALSRARAGSARKAAQEVAPPASAGEGAAPTAPALAEPAPEKPAPRRMPLAPPPIADIAPPAPWQGTETSAQASAAASSAGLRRLGGDLPPATEAGTAAGGQPAPWDPAQPGAAARPSGGELSLDQRGARPAAKEAPQADYDRMGRKVGGNYGFLLTLAVVFLDYYIEGPFGIIKRGGINSALPVFGAAIIGGYAYGVLIGLATARTRSLNVTVLLASGVWALVAFALIVRVPQLGGGGGFIMGVLMGAGYGMITGYLIFNNVMAYLKRV